MRTTTTIIALTLSIAAGIAVAGGRCSPKEAAADSAKRATGVEDKGPIEKRRDDDKGVVKKIVK